MIEGAEKLAREEKAVCRFEVGDAMKTGFPDGSFDFVVSRNLTWTLPDPEQAYREWLRVLKPGGLLLNFDANYGLDNAADLAAVPKNHTHMQLGMSTLQENEAIKETLPINGYARPAWDLEILRRLGIGEFRIDTSAGKQIYICEDEFYNPAPVFALCVRKPLD
jgi:SAM-dependent methyltransferase